MVVALGVLLVCGNICDTTGWQWGASTVGSGLVFVFVTVRVTGYVAVSGCLSCSLWVEGSTSHDVSEGDSFSSGCGVPSCLSCLGNCPFLASWNGASPPTPNGSSCFAQQCPPHALLSPVGPGALQQLTFLLT